MLVRKDYVTFTVMGQEINLISDTTAHGLSTVAEIDNHFYHLGNELPVISSAIFAWQEVNDRDLTNEELRQVMVDNHLISEGI